jgi:hypothetical protein
MQSLKKNQLTIGAVAALSIGLLAGSCKKNAESESTPATESPVAAAGNGTSNKEVAVDFPKQYCEQLDKVKLRTDVSLDLAFFCKSGAPTTNFRKYYTSALNGEAGKIDLVPIKVQHDEDTGFSNIQIAWSFHVPILIADFRNKPIYQAIAKTYESPTISQTTSTERLADESLDSGLHIWSINFNYDMTIKGPQGLELKNKRKTQYNLYQVQGGNENLGLGVEHLVDPANPDYQKSTMLNFSLSAGPDKGGAVVITLLNFSLANRNFPKTAEDSIEEVARNVAEEMYKALKE